MNKINNGGSAFPYRDEMSILSGMSLRDYFAAKAIIGFTSATNQDGDWTGWDLAKEIAREAYNIADAMLKERDNTSS